MVTDVGLQDLEQALEDGAQLLDVRESDAYAEGHVPGAQLLPLSVLPLRMHELPRDRPVYFVSSNPHSLVNLVTPTARAGEAEIVGFIETHGPEYLRNELERFRAGRAEGSWENFLYFGARLLWESLPEDGDEWRRRQRAERAPAGRRGRRR